MGLLSRAGENFLSKPKPVQEITEKAKPEKVDFSLDEMGKALSERIMRLPEGEDTPYIALNLLKAFAAFHTGFCLTLKNSVYYSYTTVGITDEAVSIPLEELWSEKKPEAPFFRLDSGKNTGITGSQENCSYWVFPLDSLKEDPSEPWENIMILGVSDSAGVSSGFTPESVSAIISVAADKFKTGVGVGSDSESIPELYSPDVDSPEPSPGFPPDAKVQELLHKEIAEFNLIHAEFNCLLLENPNPSEEEKNNFTSKVSEMLGGTGNVVALSKGNPLILLPKRADRDLIAHRL